MSTESLQPWTQTEAIAWKRRVQQAATDLRQLLWEGYERAVWWELGYLTWTACLEAIAEELDMGITHLWRLHHANQTERVLSPGTVATIPEKHLRPLRGLTPEQKQAVWQKAQQTAPEGRMTEAHVAQVGLNPTLLLRAANYP
jgi:hypothetical protein